MTALLLTREKLRELGREVLTPKQFEAWELCRLNNVSYRTIAYMLDLDKGTVRDRVKRADQRIELRIRELEAR